MSNKLKPKFNPAGWQWEQDGVVYPLEDLSREDLLQVACECIQALEHIEDLQGQLGQMMASWRQGKVVPSED